MLIGLHNIPLLDFVIELNFFDELRRNYLTYQKAFLPAYISFDL